MPYIMLFTYNDLIIDDPRQRPFSQLSPVQRTMSTTYSDKAASFRGLPMNDFKACSPTKSTKLSCIHCILILYTNLKKKEKKNTHTSDMHTILYMCRNYLLLSNTSRPYLYQVHRPGAAIEHRALDAQPLERRLCGAVAAQVRRIAQQTVRLRLRQALIFIS